MKLFLPVPPGMTITQKFGENPDWYPTSKGHNGIDYGNGKVGNNVYAMEGGQVLYSGDFNNASTTNGKIDYGRNIRLQHHEGISIYGHLSKRYVQTGDIVTAGQLIGLTGGATDDPNSGKSSGPHLHAEYRLTSGAPQVPGGFVYGAIDLIPLFSEDPDKALFRVRVDNNRLMIRSGPSQLSSWRGTYATDHGEYDIYEVVTYHGDIMNLDYGRISTISSDWICIDPNYVTRITSPAPKPETLSFKQRLERLEKMHGIGA